ncbi:MAG: NAD(P)-dependent oxidoreductase, partial [Haloferacaceae archaeon]
DNDRKYYSLSRAKQVLGYEPRDNSADYHFDGTPKEEASQSEDSPPPTDG